jgi:hypothetical protein
MKERVGLGETARSRRRRGAYALAGLLVLLAGAATFACARAARTAARTSSVVLSVETDRPGVEFAPGSVGLSMGTQELSSGHLNAEHHRLVRMLRLLGPSVLRVGAGTVDFSWWTSTGESPPPWAKSTVAPSDLIALHRLLVATGWRALLGVNLGHFEPARAAEEARYAQEILGSGLAGIEVGNEPDEYSNNKIDLRPPSYDVEEYLTEADAYTRAIRAAAPGVSVYGPATSGTQWLTKMGAGVGMFNVVTQHYYATSTCPHLPSNSDKPPPTAAGLLSPAVREQENETLSALTRAGVVAGRPTLIGETNSVSCKGSISASPVFASALWSLDWVLRAASSGVTGLYFHGWLTGCGRESYSPICVSGDAAEASAGDVEAQPEYYGLLAASRLEGGRFVPTHVTAAGPLPDLTSWATVGPGGAVRIAIDDFAAAGPAETVSIPVSGYRAVEEQLTAPSVVARTGIALGAAAVNSVGEWRPRPVGLRRVDGFARIVVPPASAVLVTLRPKR